MDAGLIFAVISPVLSSISAIFQSGATKALSPFVVLSFGSLSGSFFIVIVMLLSGKRFSIEKTRKHWKDLLMLIVSRQIIGQFFYTFGLFYTTAIKAIFLTKVEPYFVVFWFWLFRKEKIHPKHIFLLGIHILGAILLSAGEMGVFTLSQLGDLLIVTAMLCFSYSYFPATKVSHEVGAMQANAIMLFLAGIFFLPFAIIFGKPTVWSPSLGWAYLLIGAFIFSTVSQTLWFVSLKSVKGWMVSAMRALGPLVGTPFAYFLFGDTLSLVQLLGGTLVLSTSFLIALEHLKATKKKNSI